jgi:hypothetical protein
MVNYILRILIALDQFLNVVICNGEPDETMSSACYRMERDGRFWGFMRPVIDTVFRPWMTDHCRRAYEAEVLRQQYSKEFQL